jgi:cell shape-determining protein MreC
MNHIMYLVSISSFLVFLKFKSRKKRKNDLKSFKKILQQKNEATKLKTKNNRLESLMKSYHSHGESINS